MVPVLALVLLLAAGQAPPVDDLGVVRGHYATAAYEEALAHIGALEPARVTPELEQLRALCLLALGRSDEGQQSFERLVRQAPLYLIPEADIAPRMYTVFRDVRRRVLPLIVRDLYNQGKSSFDAKQYEAATTELRAMMRVLGDPDAAADATAFADLRQLADGFLRLAEAELALAARVAATPPPAATPTPADAPAAGSSTRSPEAPAAPTTTRADGLIVTKIVVYSRDDRAVTPPVEVSRFMPAWNPPPAMRLIEYRGELEVIVDETGRVQQARMLRPSNPSYDVTLVGATERWRFAPARLEGEPVKYRLTFQVVLAPRQ